MDNAIKFLGKWMNHSESIWIIKTESSAKAIKNFLKVFLDDTDTIFITGLDGEAEWMGYDENSERWMTNYLLK